MTIKLTGKDYLDIEAGVYTPIKVESRRSRPAKRVLLHCLLGALLLAAAAHQYGRTAFSSVLVPVFALLAPAPVVPPVSVFEIVPKVPIAPSAYTSSHLLFNASTIADGLKTKFHAPEVFNFTGGYLTLNFSVEAQPAFVSSPVVEISVGSSPIWRSATPGARADAAVVSSTTKNITEYLSLFQENQKVTFAVLEAGDAPVSVSLELVLYNDTSAASVASGQVSASALFTSVGPASSVYALQKKVVSLPSESFSVDLPQLNSNVTTAKVSLFASASEDEVEFYKASIAGVAEPVDGNGPVRLLNVFVGGIYAGSVQPKPTLFHADKITTGGEKLWTPVVDSGSFSGFTYDVDLIAVLPLLWKGPQTLDIVIVSPVDASTGGSPPVGHPPSAVTNLLSGSWLVSGNFLAWESLFVAAAVGSVVSTNSSQLDSGVVVAPPVFSPWQPKVKNTVVRTSVEGTITSSFKFTLVDNSTAIYNVVANSSSVGVLTKQESTKTTPVGPPGSGAELSETLAAAFFIGASSFELDVQNPLTNMTLFKRSIKADYPLTINTSTKTDYAGVETSKFSADIGIGLESKVNEEVGVSLKIDEKLRIDDIVGTSTDVRVRLSDEKVKYFSREVQVVNGHVVSDLPFEHGEVF